VTAAQERSILEKAGRFYGKELRREKMEEERVFSGEYLERRGKGVRGRGNKLHRM